MEKILKFEYGGLRFYLCCRDEIVTHVQNAIEHLNAEGYNYLMTQIINERIPCKVEAIVREKKYVDRARRYNEFYMELGNYLGN